MKTWEIIEIREKSILVATQNQGEKLLVSKYKDKGGIYFFNGQLKKQYVKNTPIVENKKPQKEQKKHSKKYTFEVEYEHKGRLNGFALTETTVKAASYEKAIQKVYKKFKNIYEISEA